MPPTTPTSPATATPPYHLIWLLTRPAPPDCDALALGLAADAATDEDGAGGRLRLMLGRTTVDVDEDLEDEGEDEVELTEALLDLEPDAALEPEVLLGRVIVALGRVTGLSAVAHWLM